MNTYSLTLGPAGYYGVTRWGPPSLAAETVTNALKGAVVRSLVADTTGGLNLDLQLQRPSHEQALDDIVVALQQIGWNVIDATVTEWVSATAQGLVLGAFGFGAAGSAIHDPEIMVLAGFIGAIAGGIAGSFVQNVKVVYQAQRAYPSGWVLTPVQRPTPVGPIVQLG